MLRAAAIAKETFQRTRLKARLGAASLVASLSVALALRVYWAFLLPFNDAPDEYCHYPMVAYLASHWLPPTMADVPGTIPVSYPAMSPLGYVPLAIPVAILGADHEWAFRAARISNAILGSLMVGLVYLAMRALTPKWPLPAGLAAWLAALHPQLVFVSSYVNNDMAMLVAASGLWLAWIRLARERDRANRWVWWVALGVLCGLAILCKPNVVGVILAGGPIVAICALEGRRPDRAWHGMTGPAIAAISMLVACGPWFIWNWRHHGSLLGLDVHRVWWNAHTKAANVRQGYLKLANLGDFVAGTWESSWACFGYATTRLGSFDYLLMTLTSGIAFGAFLSRRGDRRLIEGWPSPRSAKVAWWSLGLGFVFVWLAHAYHSAQFGMSAQGRYVLPAALPVIAVLSVGSSFVALRGVRWVGPLLLVSIFGWMQWSSVAAEKLSNRLDQPDRRVRARLQSYEMDLPGVQPYEGTVPRILGDGAITERVDGLHLDVKAGSFVGLGPPVRGNSLGGVLIEQLWLGGEPRDGLLRLVSTDGSGEVLARIPYRDARIGLGTYRFDLRKAAGLLGDRLVQVEIAVSDRDARVEWHAAELLGLDLAKTDRLKQDEGPQKHTADVGRPGQRVGIARDTTGRRR